LIITFGAMDCLQTISVEVSWQYVQGAVEVLSDETRVKKKPSLAAFTAYGMPVQYSKVGHRPDGVQLTVSARRHS
jgi:hypothetical protein